jgi:hypothetical protein
MFVYAQLATKKTFPITIHPKRTGYAIYAKTIATKVIIFLCANE